MKKARSSRPARSACDMVSSAAADRELVLAIASWFEGAGRDLPWRSLTSAGRRDPWRSLVSEVMLQQTQVSRVLERFSDFMGAFPTARAMHAAGEDAVLARWAGMGYYRRARFLYAAAAELVERFGGVVPETVAELRTLPGIGRYTAGAVSSIVFGHAEPIVDGNVSRVLLRIHGVEQSAAEGADWCWARASELTQAAGDRIAAFNEGLMELGAVICTPQAPRCGECPAAPRCEAKRLGKQGSIPSPKKAPKRSTILCQTFVLRNAAGDVLIERRPATGMWAGLWQAPTLETPGAESPRPPREALAELGLAGAKIDERPVLDFEHGTTHRAVRFLVYAGRLGARATRGRRWAPVADAIALGVSNAQKRILGRESGLFG